MTVVIEKVTALDKEFPGITAVDLAAVRMSYICFLGSIDGKVACLWGLIPPCLISEKAYLWLCTNDVVKEHTFVFIRHSQRVLEEMLKEFPTIVGHCHIQDYKAIRWLKWLGAIFGDHDKVKIPFVIRKKG